MELLSRDRQSGSWVGERNRAVLIATSFSIFFGLLLLAPGIGELFQAFTNMFLMTLSDVGVPGLGQEVNGLFSATTLGLISIVAIIWLFAFFASFPSESD